LAACNFSELLLALGVITLSFISGHGLVKGKTKIKEQTKIVMYSGQKSNLGTTAFLLINRRFHCFWRETDNVGGSSKFSLCSFANAQ
jgi:hypothetical protein